MTGWLRCLGGAWLLALLLLATPATVYAQATSAAPQDGVVAQLSFVDQADLQRLVVRYDVWHVNHAARAVTVWLTPAELRQVQAQSRSVVVDQAATDDFYAAQAAVNSAQNSSGIPGYTCYRTVEETHAAMAQLAADHPTLVRPVSLGKSWAWTNSSGGAGYTIPGVVLTNQAITETKPIFFLMAAIHAREYTTAESALRFAEQLVHRYGVDPDATWLLDYTEIHIVPQTNPDGRKRAEAELDWRKNVNSDFCAYDSDYYGVDLNRNSSFKWAQCVGSGFICSSSDPCSIVYRGTAPTSEPEVQAIEGYMRAIFPDARGALDTDAVPTDTPGLMISLHSYYPKILFPWGWTPTPAPNHQQLQTLARKFGFYTGYPACQSGADGCIYRTDGTTDDFAYGELGVAAYTFELGTRFFQACATFETTIITPTLASLTYAAKAAAQPYLAPAGPEVVNPTLSAEDVVASGQVVTLTVTADDGRFYSGGYGQEPTQTIQAVRYTIGQPAWITGTVSYPLAPVDGAFDAVTEQAFAAIDTTGWESGRYLLLVEAQDAGGVWGVPTAIFLEVGERRYFPFVVG
jgi:carboxypeptidase T